MKNKILKFVTTLSIIFLLLFVIFKINYVKADSGWDSSYDSGSWDSGSDWSSSYDSGSWDSGSDWSSSSNSSSGYSYHTSCTTEECIRNSFIIAIILIPLFLISIVFIILICTKKSRKNMNIPSSVNKIYNYRQISSEEANAVIPNFNIDEFNYKAYEIFYNVQMGWMEFDYDKLKELLTDELYNTYLMDLEALKIKNQKNVMKSFELIETKLVNLKEENNQYIAKVILEVKFIDYIEDSNTHKLLRGSNTHKLDNTYELTFVRTKEDKKVDICPSCGAQVNGNVSGICEYCNSKLINNTHDWVLSKKEKISQK